MSNTLEQQISDYQLWREQLAGAINDYRDWLDLTGASDGLQDLRLYDMAQAVKNDRLVLAFVAEFARGKTETINALFFSNLRFQLLSLALTGTVVIGCNQRSHPPEVVPFSDAITGTATARRIRPIWRRYSSGDSANWSCRGK